MEHFITFIARTSAVSNMLNSIPRCSREVATTDGWMVAMLRIYCEFIAMLHHPVGPVARDRRLTVNLLFNYAAAMEWKKPRLGFCPRCSRRRCQVTPDHLIIVLIMLLLAGDNNKQTTHTHEQHYYHFVLIWIRFYCLFWYVTFASLLHDMVSFNGATKAWAWLKWALHDTRDPGTGQLRESVQQLSSLTIKYNHQTRKSIPKICSCYNPK